MLCEPAAVCSVCVGGRGGGGGTAKMWCSSHSCLQVSLSLSSHEWAACPADQTVGSESWCRSWDGGRGIFKQIGFGGEICWCIWGFHGRNLAEFFVGCMGFWNSAKHAGNAVSPCILPQVQQFCQLVRSEARLWIECAVQQTGFHEVRQDHETVATILMVKQTDKRRDSSN